MYYILFHKTKSLYYILVKLCNRYVLESNLFGTREDRKPQRYIKSNKNTITVYILYLKSTWPSNK